MRLIILLVARWVGRWSVALMSNASPNPRLQRTRWRAPLSREPFGDESNLETRRENRMPKSVVCLVVLFLIVSVCGAAEIYSLDVDIKPAAPAGNYVCLASVSDLATGERLFSPKIAFKAGSQATANGGAGNPTFELTVKVDPNSATATALLRVTHDGKLVASQRASVQIR
jgi:hypothetical protein